MTAPKRKRGKPPTTGATRREQVNVRLAPGTTARLEAVAARANRKPSDWARLVIEAALDRAEALAARDARQAELDERYAAELGRPVDAPCTCTAADRQAGGHAPGCPAGDELAGGVALSVNAVSKSVARRLAATGGPAPACTCPYDGQDLTALGHDSDCPRAAYYATLRIPRT